MSTIGGPTGSSHGHLAYFHRYDNENENEMARERTEGKAEGRAGNQSTRISLTQRVVVAFILVHKVILVE